MRERLQGFINSIRERFQALTNRQRIQLASVTVAFLAVLAITIYLTVRTRMEVLVDNRDLTVVSNMQNALNDANIKSRVVNNGRGLAVDEKRIIDAQVLIAQNDLLAESGGATGFTYLDALNYSGMGTTETIKRENMKKVKETELGNALRLFDGISRATVNLTLPDDNYFYVKPTESARASAVLTTDRTLNKSESLQVARFLCASVKGLTLENIEISDQNFNIIYSGLQEVNGGASTQYDQELLRKNEIEMKIKVSLSPLFDSVSVINDNLKFNWDKFVETSEVLSSPINGSDTGVIIKENTEKNTSTSASTGAAPGLTANDQQTNTYQTSNNTGGGASSSNAANTEYGYNRTQTTVESASGTLDTAASTIAVMVYKNRIYDEAVLRENGQLNGQSWDDFRLSLTETPLVMDFDPIQDIISKGTGLNAANISVYGYEMPVFVDSPEQTLNVTQIILFSLLGLLLAMLAFALMRGAGKNEEVTETEPELSVEALLETTRIDEEKQAERIRLQEIELDKEPEAKKLIDKFVNERPEAVAQLLRNWLNENWE